MTPRRTLALVAALASCLLAPASARRGHCPPHCPNGHPVPPPTPRPYESIGSIDIDTYENTIFWWAKKTFVLESKPQPPLPPTPTHPTPFRNAELRRSCWSDIPCTYQDHAGQWFPAFKGHSYARIRDFMTGEVVANISSTIGFGFVNSFPDYDHNRLWLFGALPPPPPAWPTFPIGTLAAVP